MDFVAFRKVATNARKALMALADALEQETLNNDKRKLVVRVSAEWDRIQVIHVVHCSSFKTINF